MKTTELIEKLNGLYKISAKVAYGEIKITRVSDQPYKFVGNTRIKETKGAWLKWQI